MRGEVIYFDAERGMGFLSGADGNRYAFERGAVKGGGVPTKGTRVEFEPDGGNALRIVLVDRPARDPGFDPAARQRLDRAPSVPTVTAASAGSVPAGDTGDMSDTGVFGYFRRVFFENYANFRGRARRKEYWSFVLVCVLAMVALSLVTVVIDAMLGNLDAENPIVTIVVSTLVALALIIPSLAVTVRRQHDIGLSGWFILVMFIPTIGNLILLVFALIPSQKHDNKWGPVPEGV